MTRATNTSGADDRQPKLPTDQGPPMVPNRRPRPPKGPRPDGVGVGWLRAGHFRNGGDPPGRPDARTPVAEATRSGGDPDAQHHGGVGSRVSSVSFQRRCTGRWFPFGVAPRSDEYLILQSGNPPGPPRRHSGAWSRGSRLPDEPASRPRGHKVALLGEPPVRTRGPRA
jgi:hypothetical protein